MGTSCGTIIKDKDDRVIVFIYRQFDGYPTMHGDELKEILKGSIVNDTGRNTNAFNGMYELAAIVVQKLKIIYPQGNIYLYPPEMYNEMDWLDYTYEILPPEENSNSKYPRIICRNYRGVEIKF